MFAKLERSKLELLAFASEHLTFEDGEELCQLGGLADGVYVILEGTADLLVDTDKGISVRGTLGVHDIAGDVAVLSHSPRPATVRAKGQVEALRISAATFEQFLAENPDEALHVMRLLSDKLANCQREA